MGSLQRRWKAHSAKDFYRHLASAIHPAAEVEVRGDFRVVTNVKTMLQNSVT